LTNAFHVLLSCWLFMFWPVPNDLPHSPVKRCWIVIRTDLAGGLPDALGALSVRQVRLLGRHLMVPELPYLPKSICSIRLSAVR
jgi:hypothetical protein